VGERDGNAGGFPKRHELIARAVVRRNAFTWSFCSTWRCTRKIQVPDHPDAEEISGPLPLCVRSRFFSFRGVHVRFSAPVIRNRGATSCVAPWLRLCSTRTSAYGLPRQEDVPGGDPPNSRASSHRAGAGPIGRQSRPRSHLPCEASRGCSPCFRSPARKLSTCVP
jgi:hypothetical protein